MDSNAKAEAVREYSDHTKGTDKYTRHWLRTILYTDGMAYLAETCGAFWLIDVVASHQIKPRVRAEEFQLWRLYPVRDDDGAIRHWNAEAWTDTPSSGTRIVRQEIPFSDFPAELCEPKPFEWFVTGPPLRRIMLLKEEY